MTEEDKKRWDELRGISSNASSKIRLFNRGTRYFSTGEFIKGVKAFREMRQIDLKYAQEDEKNYINLQIFVSSRFLFLANKLQNYKKNQDTLLQGNIAALRQVRECKIILEKVISIYEWKAKEAGLDRPKSEWVLGGSLSYSEIERVSRNISAFLEAFEGAEDLHKGAVQEALAIEGNISEVWTHLEQSGIVEVRRRGKHYVSKQ